ncbi:MAG: FAD-dependent oxidoreductase [Acidimicrobiales bacterium]
MDIAIVGAGLAGLAAAVELHEAGHAVQVFEASDRPGGRVATDDVDGHLCDRGFQIMLAAYPDAGTLIDLDRLDMRWFAPGALVRRDGRFHRLGDPLQAPATALTTLRAPVGTLADKLRILSFRQAVRRGPVGAVWTRPETTARQRLEEAGFSPVMIEGLLGPLFAGITLDPELGVSSRVLEFVFRMLSAGPAGVPARGMGAIPAQLAARLPDGAVATAVPVEAVGATAVTLADGEQVAADAVVVATDRAAASRLCGLDDPGWRSSTTMWLAAAPEVPVAEPILVLNGDGTSGGPPSSLAVMSAVSPAYAPSGSSTIAVSAPGTGAELVDALRAQLRSWYGPVADTWATLRIDEIAHSHPVVPIGTPRTLVTALDRDRHPTEDPGAAAVWVCGDHLADPSINGAIASGRAAATAVLTARPARTTA